MPSRSARSVLKSVGNSPQSSLKQSSQKAKAPTHSAGAREKLLRAAKKLFAHKGLSGTSIRDLAKEAKVNSSMISYYFQSKEGLYRECLRDIGDSRLGFAQTVLAPAQDPSEYKVRLKLFLENLIQVFLDDREVGLIVLREYDRVNSPAEDVFHAGFARIFDLLNNFFTHAKDKGLLAKDSDPVIITSLVFGTIASQMRIDHIVEKKFGRSIRNLENREKTLQQIVAFVFK